MHDKPICIDEYWLCEVDYLQFHVFKVSNLVIFSIILCYTIFLKNKFVLHIFLGSRRGGYPLLELHQCRKKTESSGNPKCSDNRQSKRQSIYILDREPIKTQKVSRSFTQTLKWQANHLTLEAAFLHPHATVTHTTGLQHTPCKPWSPGHSHVVLQTISALATVQGPKSNHTQ